MTTTCRRRPARHSRRRETGTGLLLLDYPDPDSRSGRPTGVIVRRRPGRRFRGRNLVAPRGRNAVAVAVSAALALTAFSGGLALLRSSGGGGKAPRVAAVLPSLFPALARSSPTVTMARLRDTELMPSVLPVHYVTPPVSPSSPAPSGTAPPRQTIAVSYAVVAQSAGEFRGEVAVGNNGSSPISGWQIVVALPDDWITSFQDASGYVSHHVMLLQPPPSAPAIAPGATLRVFFAAEGPETTPEICAFNDIACG